jgi:cytochrome c peroxidase
MKITMLLPVLFCLCLPGTAPLPTVLPSDPNLIRWGHYLFQSTLLSRDRTIACGSCHVATLGFSGEDPVAVGVGGFTVGRRAPALLDLRHAQAFMWDGRFRTLDQQIAAPLESQEMQISWAQSVRWLEQDPAGAALARTAHVAVIGRESVIAALAAYVASLDAGPAPFDRFYQDHDPLALTDQERWGFRLFVRKAECASCHLVQRSRPDFTDRGFHDVGVRHPDRDDLGRFLVTGAPQDRHAFKTPSLRDVALRPTLMHDGSMTDLEQVVRYYNKGGAANDPDQDPRLKPLFLSDPEIAAIVAFLKTLTTDKAVRSNW